MRKTALAAGGIALVIALSACGNDGGGGTAQSGTEGLFGSAQELGLAAKEGTAKSKTSKFTMDTEMGGQKITGQGQGRYDGPNTAMAMTMDVSGQTMEMRLVDKSLYVKMPEAMRGQMGDGKPWMKVQDDQMNQMLGGSVDQSDPSKLLEQVQKAGTITKSEKTSLDGQEVTHYVVDIDLAKAAEQGAAGLPKESIDQLKGKVDKLPMELWINKDKLPVQVMMDMTPVLQAAGQQGTGKITMKYTDWGAPVDIQAPPADQVGEFTMPR